MNRILIADDEPPARDRIRRLVESRSDCEVIAECGDGASTLDALLEHSPDILLLDVQMPELTGFEVLAALPKTVRRPAIIFTTAYDEHALAAFDVAAIDYLLKPWSPARLHAALDRAISQTNAPQDELAPLQQLLQQVSQTRDLRLTIRDGDSVHFVASSAIDYIQAAGNYLEIHTEGSELLHRETLTSMEERLTPLGFFRLSRSTLVNLSRIREVSAPRGGNPQVRLDNQVLLPLTRPLKELEAAIAERGIS